MAGTSEGAKKAALTNKQKYGENIYAEIGALSWKDPNRSRKTGFALMTEEQRREAGKKGGSKKKTIRKANNEEPNKTSTGVSE